MKKKTATAAVIACLLTTPAFADSWLDQFKDDEDGWLDVSDWVLENSSGFMPVPITITEPAVGAGLGVAALFFHAPKDYDPAAEQEGFVDPDITAVAAGATENGTWFVGGGHFAQWRNDTIRYEGVLGYAEVNVKFYGADESGQATYSDGVEFKGEALFIQQPLSFRMGGSDFFLGAEWEYMVMETRPDLGTGIPEIDELVLDVQLSGLKAFLKYDAVDNSFTPNSGLNAEVGISRNDKSIGSDFEYNELEAKMHWYRQFGEKFVLGTRLEAQTVSGDVPFFSVPFIGLRGIPALRYQGEAVVVGEFEARWAMHPRISAIGFVGGGRAADKWGDLGSATTRTTRGAGVRYFIARKLGMHVGVDVAKGPEDTHYYMTFGSAWD